MPDPSASAERFIADWVDDDPQHVDSVQVRTDLAALERNAARKALEDAAEVLAAPALASTPLVDFELVDWLRARAKEIK